MQHSGDLPPGSAVGSRPTRGLRLAYVRAGFRVGGHGSQCRKVTTTTLCVCSGEGLVIDEDEFFDSRYDFDFSDLKDTGTFYRGGEVYRRPCGWLRFALKVWDKYPDGNAWLGERGYRTTTTYSVPGEWPVSYHGTSKNGARAIIVTNYQPGPGQKYGRGVYSTPYLEHAVEYTRTFQSSVTGKNYRVVMQNRVNPAYRERHNGGVYWLLPVPDGLTQEQEQDLVEKAIRPYAVLIKPL
ncbi:uncharacterized protein LOC133157584 isoform X2 [Syngnathus typhle]|uniref:uncharacterized protein LOC133157584 isoform X2 n=1 Tax=Syngnathus typhle TaxID=161592 RepID=UPI002A6B83E2|nr:uncharacterized protein LOC133157584 isoform X2 [Syngnathus typhle]